MNRDTFRLGLGLTTLVVILGSAVAFTVREEHTALVTRFGELVRTVDEPGLHWKLPWPVERTQSVDRRTRVLETRHSEMLTRDKKNVVLVSFALWRVADAARFAQAVGDAAGAEDKLDGLVTDAKIGVLGRYDLSALVSTDAALLQAEAVEADVLAAVRATASERYGIEVIDVGFQRLSLPADNIEAVFDQMRAERRKFADAYRAAGERDASAVRADADLEVARALAEAEEEAARIRGEAEAEAARIYAEAEAADPELFDFLRRLETLEAMVGDQTTVILQTDQSPFDLLTNDDGSDVRTVGVDDQ
ncbi:MAG: protease modulator HflC [Planctomycetota bacterium]